MSDDNTLIDSCQDRDELLDLHGELTVEITEIRSQLRKAKARAAMTGDYADSTWFHAASDALAIKGQQAQRIQRKLRKLKKEAAAEENARFETAFFDVVKEALPTEQFEDLLEQAAKLARSRA